MDLTVREVFLVTLGVGIGCSAGYYGFSTSATSKVRRSYLRKTIPFLMSVAVVMFILVFLRLLHLTSILQSGHSRCETTKNEDPKLLARKVLSLFDYVKPLGPNETSIVNDRGRFEKPSWAHEEADNLFALQSQPQPPIHACIRTKDQGQYLLEFMAYYIYHGISSFTVMDDSDASRHDTKDVMESLQASGINITYLNVGGLLVPDENFHLYNCFKANFGSDGYLLNIDDDEFIFPMVPGDNPEMRIVDVLRSDVYKKHTCSAMPLYFFGSNGIQEKQTSTIDKFLQHDSLVSKEAWNIRTSADKNRIAKELYAGEEGKVNRIKKRHYKAIFNMDAMAVPIDFLFRLRLNKKKGSLIHGYGVDCFEMTRSRDVLLGVAHYTRSREDLLERTKAFWHNIPGLRHRFSSEKKLVSYIRKRDRNEILDTRVSIYKQVVDETIQKLGLATP